MKSTKNGRIYSKNGRKSTTPLLGQFLPFVSNGVGCDFEGSESWVSFNRFDEALSKLHKKKQQKQVTLRKFSRIV